jgi:hypothetical protein
MNIYEQQLAADPSWAIREGSMHFDSDSAVHKALLKFVKRLDNLRIPYALVGGMAMFFHGYRRFTEDVDILVSTESLQMIHDELLGLGYVSVFEGSKNLRDAELGVRIEFLVSGQFPGDGKPKPVAFPLPENVVTKFGGIKCIELTKLVELKLASGSSPGRRRDLADVQELIRILQLPETFELQLDLSVRSLYRDLSNELRDASEE